MKQLGNPILYRFKKKLEQHLELDDLNDCIETLCLSFLLEINRSLLAGKYIKYEDLIKRYEANITELELFLSKEYISNFKIPNDEEKLLNHLIKFIEYCKNIYSLFVSNSQKTFSFRQIEYVDCKIYIDEKNDFYSKYSIFIELFNINIDIAKIDQLFLKDDNL